MVPNDTFFFHSDSLRFFFSLASAARRLSLRRHLSPCFSKGINSVICLSNFSIWIKKCNIMIQRTVYCGAGYYSKNRLKHLNHNEIRAHRPGFSWVKNKLTQGWPNRLDRNLASIFQVIK